MLHAMMLPVFNATGVDLYDIEERMREALQNKSLDSE